MQIFSKKLHVSSLGIIGFLLILFLFTHVLPGNTAQAQTAGTAVTSFQLTSGVTGTLPFTVGLAFKDGDIPGNPVLSIPNSQVIVKTRWNDGSAKMAIVSADMSLTSGVPSSVSVSNGSPAMGTNLTAADIQAANPSATVSLGSYGSVNLSSLLSSPFSTWISGPEMVEAHYRASVGSDPTLQVWFYVRLYKSGKMWVRTVVSNGYLDTVTTTKFPFSGPITTDDKIYSPTVTIGGVVVYGASNVTQYGHTSWTQEGWIGTSDPKIIPTFNTGYLESTNLVPNYFNETPTNAAFTGLYQNYEPFQNGNWTPHLGNTGYQPTIGILPLWEALYITSGSDVRAYKAVLANAEAINSYPIVWDDSVTKLPVKPSDRPDWTRSGQNQGVYGTGDDVFAWDGAHHGSAGYLAYILTGDYYYLDTMENQAASIYLGTMVNNGLGTSRILLGQTRGVAWYNRTIGQLVAIGPSNDPIVSDYRALFATQATHWDAVAHQAGQNQIGYLWSYEVAGSAYNGEYGITGAVVPPWMQNFWVQTYGYLSHIQPLADMSALNGARDYLYKSIVGSLGGGGANNYCYTNASAYNMVIGDASKTDSTAWYNSWGQVFQKTYGIPNPNTCGTSLLSGNHSSGPNDGSTGYWGNLMPAIAYAVTDGAPGAAASWARMTSATNWSSVISAYYNTPQWGIAPYSYATPLPPMKTPPATPYPTVNFSGNGNYYMTLGQTMVFTWSSTNTTSCAGSGTDPTFPALITGTSGSVSVTPTVKGVPGHSYTITCTGPGGVASQNILLDPEPSASSLVTASLSAPSSITAGQSATLTWGSTNATSCTATNFTPTGTSGSVSVSPITTTTYSINCTGTAGSANKSLTITVGPVGTLTPTATLSSSASSLTSGQTASLTWSSTNATSCVGTGFTAGSVAGSFSVSPTTTTTYSVTCGGATQSTTITVTAASVAQIQNLSLSGSSDFSQTNTCSDILAAGQSCSVTVTFTPSASGQRTGQLSFTDSTSNTSTTIALTGVGVQQTTPPPTQVPPSGSAQGTLSAVASTMQPGVWTQLAGTAVAPLLKLTVNQLNTYTLGNSGPASVFNTWNGSAYDATGMRWFFTGGGRGDYGGNEVYQFNFNTLSWSELTKPSVLVSTSENLCPVPTVGPPSAHTHQSIIYSPRSSTMWYLNDGARFCTATIPANISQPAPGPSLWEFNPDTATWVSHNAPPVGDSPASILDSSGNPIFIAPSGVYLVDALAKTWKNISGADNVGYPNAVSCGGSLWINDYNTFRKWSLDYSQRTILSRPSLINYTNGMLCDSQNNRLVFWNGTTVLAFYNIGDATWTYYRPPGDGPIVAGSAGVQSKWIYIPQYGVYAGYNNINQGIWVIKLPAPNSTVALAGNTVQQTASAFSPIQNSSFISDFFSSILNGLHAIFSAVMSALERIFGILSGARSAQPAAIILSLNSSSLDFGQVTIGSSVTQTVTFTMPGSTQSPLPQASPTISFSISSSVITPSASANLSWSASNATSCTGTGFSTAGMVSGSVTLSPTQTTTYSIVCTGPGGSTTGNTTVTVATAQNGNQNQTPSQPSTSVFAGSSATPTQTSSSNSQTSQTSNPSQTQTPSSVSIDHVLFFGKEGSEVTALQTYLVAQDLLSADFITGFYGSLTRAAVERYQCDHGIVCTGNESSTGYGVVGPKTIQMITGTAPTTTSVSVTRTSSSTGTSSGITALLYYGLKSQQVSILQSLLITDGFLAPGSNTGFFGPLTRGAVKRFQCSRNVVCTGDESTTGWGTVGPKTRRALGG